MQSTSVAANVLATFGAVGQFQLSKFTIRTDLILIPGVLVNSSRQIAPKTSCTNLELNCFALVQLIPQIVLNYRRHDTTGLQPSMMLLWASAGLPLGIYNILSHKTIALQIQPQILTSLSLITWAQCMYYGHVGVRP